jgi:DNA adenine methylase
VSKKVATKSIPFLRWAGGKRWLSPAIHSFAASVPCEGYVEPFLGGGSIFFKLQPSTALLCDTNSELINAFRQVKKSPNKLERGLCEMPVSKDDYYRVRADQPPDSFNRALRFIYLNRTCFNGLWRTNKQGYFNVPYGQGTRTPSTILGNNTLQSASLALQSATLAVQDFRKTLLSVGENELVFCDPAYTVKHSNNSFLRYNEKVFAWEDQIDLHDHIIDAYEAGAVIVMTNAAHESIRNLYHPFKPILVKRRSAVGAKKGRGQYSEYLFVISRRRADRQRMYRLVQNTNLS